MNKKREMLAEQILLKEKRIEYWEEHKSLPSYEDLDEEAFNYLERPKDRNLFA